MPGSSRRWPSVSRNARCLSRCFGVALRRRLQGPRDLTNGRDSHNPRLVLAVGRLAGRARPVAAADARLPAAQQRIRRWQAAETTRLNYGQWQSVTGQPIHTELTGNLDLLRRRDQQECAGRGDDLDLHALLPGHQRPVVADRVERCGVQHGPRNESEMSDFVLASLWFTAAAIVTENT